MNILMLIDAFHNIFVYIVTVSSLAANAIFGNVIMVIATVITAAATVTYTVFTMKLLEQQKKRGKH